jgi:hypothetical protein
MLPHEDDHANYSYMTPSLLVTRKATGAKEKFYIYVSARDTS